MIEDIAEAIDEFKRDVMPKTMAAIKELKAEYPEDWQRGRRTEYLKAQMVGVVYRTMIVMHNYDMAVRNGDNMETRLFLGGQIIGGVKTIQRLQSEIIYLKHPGPKNGKGRAITDDMICNAREYPYETLLPPMRAGRCACPIHGGKNTMSFSVKNNFGRCFSCHFAGDTIAFVMEKDGVSFADAVRRLQ